RTEDEIISDLSVLSDDVDLNSTDLILITHNPPKDTKTDMISGGIHVGSEKVRSWIEEHKPFFVVTGHIHESFGIDYIGEIPVINPGALCEGNYVVLEVERDEKDPDSLPKISSIELKSLN
ncbi:MAG: metallophosphoesterase family protein, partial [Spirochaetaceae bacterium]|nr:metallophosphoesterase family protein [Spirochaetaceae bacterium]